MNDIFPFLQKYVSFPESRDHGGLINLHTNCFANAVAQSLFSCPMLRAYINGIENNGAATISALKNVFQRLNLGEIHFPNQLCKVWWNEERKKGAQHDAVEFLDDILTKLHNEVLEVQL